MLELLLVEDDKLQADLSKELLERNTEASVDVVEEPKMEGEYDIIISDYRLGSGSFTGVDFYDHITEEGFSGEFVIFTGHEEEYVDGIEDRDIEYVLKGTDHDELYDIVDNVKNNYAEVD